jgi:hypothetical protein
MRCNPHSLAGLHSRSLADAVRVASELVNRAAPTSLAATPKLQFSAGEPCMAPRHQKR